MQLPFYVLLLAGLLTSACHGQNLTLERAGEPSLLSAAPAKSGPVQPPQGNIYCAMQDRSGRLWFGTETGAYCYDGQTFSRFTVEDGLSNNVISTILEDKAGMLWFGTNAGVCRYDGKIFSSLQIPALYGTDLLPFQESTRRKSAPVQSARISKILQDKSGNLWFGTLDAGVYRYDGLTFTNFLADEVVRCMFEDQAGHIWIGSWRNGGVYRFDGQTFSNVTSTIGLTDGMIACILEDRQGLLWFGTRDQGLYRYDGNSLLKMTVDMSIWSLYEDQAGRIWYGTDGKWGQDGQGVFCYDGQSTRNFTTQDGMSANNVFCILEDRRGQLWFGTRAMGLCRQANGVIVSLQ